MQRVRDFLKRLKETTNRYPEIVLSWLFLGGLSTLLCWLKFCILGFVVLAAEIFLINEFYLAYIKDFDAYQNLSKDAYTIGAAIVAAGLVLGYLTQEFGAAGLWALILQLLGVGVFRLRASQEAGSDVASEIRNVFASALQNAEDAGMLLLLVLLNVSSVITACFLGPLVAIYFLGL